MRFTTLQNHLKSTNGRYIYSSKIIFNGLETVQYVHKAVQLVYMVESMYESMWASTDTISEGWTTFLLCFGMLTTLPVFPFFSKFATGVRINPDKDTS